MSKELKRCPKHNGNNCDWCGGSGYIKRCWERQCQEHGCSGMDHCVPSTAEINEHILGEYHIPEGYALVPVDLARRVANNIVCSEMFKSKHVDDAKELLSILGEKV